MSKTILDGARMGSRAELHDALAAAFSLPAHYGRNLDALWDCLTEQREGTEVILTSPEAMPEALFAPLAALFLDLARTAAAGAFRLNPRLHSRGATATLKAENMSAWGLRSIPKRLPPWWVYRALYGSGGLWVRPAAMWAEQVNTAEGPRPRFLRLEDSDA